MTEAVQVAKLVIERLDTHVSGKRLQKLVYYCQAWHVTALGTRLVEDDAEAWDKGPVFQSIWNRTRYALSVSDRSLAKVELPNLNSDSTQLIDAVLAYYKQYSDGELIDMSHEQPWRDVYVKDENNVIPVKSMRRFYGRALAEGKAAPTLPLMRVSYASDEDWDEMERALEEPRPSGALVDRMRQIKTG